MIRRLIGVFLALTVLTTLSPSAAILIVQNAETRNSDPDEGRDLLQMLAEEFDNDGRVSPIAWSLTDPLFRSAVDSKLVPSTMNPDLSQMHAAAEKLRADYLLVVTMVKKEADVTGRAVLYRRGQKIWSDPELPEGNTQPTNRLLTVFTNSKVDVLNSLRAASRTWTQLLFESPLKGLTPRPRIVTPPPDPGPGVAIPEPPPVRKVDNRELMNEAMKLMASNKTSEAIALLRDAVDAEPVDVERRRALANALYNAGLAEAAADEARRAADLFPNHLDLRTLAARFWMAAGNVDEANLDLNEAVARKPDSAETRLLLAEVALEKLQVDAALSHLDFVIAQAPTADAHYKRALARALNDDEAGAKQDVEAARKLGFTQDALEWRSRYASAMRVGHAAIGEIGVAARTLLQKARANFTSKEVREDRQTLEKRAASLGGLLEVLSPPTAHRKSHGQRALALKLLGQCLAELGTFLDSGSDDAIGDATITLGEALKALASAEEAYRGEIGQDKANGGR